MNLSFKQYRAIDLTIMAVLLAISEAVVTVAATKWFPDQLFSVSTTLAIVCIVMMRWDGYAVLHAAVGGCVYCLVLGAPAQQFAIYCAGNCGALIALVLFKIVGKKRVAEKVFFSVLFVFAAYCGAESGRCAMSMILPDTMQTVRDAGAWNMLIMFLTRDCISLLFAVLTVLISRRMDGLFEDQLTYLRRVNEEERKEREAREKEDNGY